MTDLFSPEAMASYLVTMIVTGLSLLIIYIIVKKLLYKPITEMIDKRKALIEKQLREAEEKTAASVKNAKEARAKLDAAQADAAKIVSEANSRALLEADRVVKNARMEALKNSKRADEELRQERNTMLHEVRSEVTSLSMAIATKLVGESVNNEETRQKVNKWIDDQLLNEEKSSETEAALVESDSSESSQGASHE